jgi:hypothetical protein
MLIPKTALLDFKYRDYPVYLDALKKSIENPANKKLRDKAEVERQKMNTK